jgi:hypothetical protein
MLLKQEIRELYKTSKPRLDALQSELALNRSTISLY